MSGRWAENARSMRCYSSNPKTRLATRITVCNVVQSMFNQWGSIISVATKKGEIEYDAKRSKNAPRPSVVIVSGVCGVHLLNFT